MMHSVGSLHTKWKEAWLSIDTGHFEALCRYLSKHHYRTHYLDHWYEHEGKDIDKKDIYLTFDDGYLDNLLVAYPIMKKYGIKGTIFVNPEFVDPSTGIRTLESHPSPLGFLNWDEIKFLDGQDEFDIQSHSMSHNYYFCSSRVIDIHDGSDKYHWLAWISRPERKCFWQDEHQGSYTPEGTPVFEYYRALGCRQYFPDNKVVARAINLYNKGEDRVAIIKSCMELIKEYPGRYETDEEMKKRFKYELCDSKRILEEKLNKPVEFLCWPGGGYNTESLMEAENAGYKASTIASKEAVCYIDNSGRSYKRIVRYPMSSNIRKGSLIGRNRISSAENKYHLVYILKREEGDKIWTLLSKLRSLINRFL